MGGEQIPQCVLKRLGEFSGVNQTRRRFMFKARRAGLDPAGFGSHIMSPDVDPVASRTDRVRGPGSEMHILQWRRGGR